MQGHNDGVQTQMPKRQVKPRKKRCEHKEVQRLRVHARQVGFRAILSDASARVQRKARRIH
jgi:hypothetical protein